MQVFTVQEARRQAHQLHIPVRLDISVQEEVHTRYLVTMELTRMSSNKEHVRSAFKVITVMEPFSMQPTAVMGFSSRPLVSKVTTVPVGLDLQGSTSVQQVMKVVFTLYFARVFRDA